MPSVTIPLFYAYFFPQQLECGDRHLAQDLFLSWPRSSTGFPGSAAPFRRRADCVSATTVPPPNLTREAIDLDTPEKGTIATAAVELPRGGGGGGGDGPEASCSSSRRLCGGGIEAVVAAPPPPPPSRMLPPRHTFVFARPVAMVEESESKSSSSSSSADRTVVGIAGARGIVEDETRTARGSSPPNKKTAAATGAGEQQQLQRRSHQALNRQRRGVGVALAFHSTLIPPPGGGSGRPPPPLSPVLATGGREEKRYDRCGAGGVDGRDLEKQGSGCCGGGGVDGGGDERARPGRFGYSLGKPFHSQRVASAKFITFGRAGGQESGRGSDLRLVTGDGTHRVGQVVYLRLLSIYDCCYLVRSCFSL